MKAALPFVGESMTSLRSRLAAALVITHDVRTALATGKFYVPERLYTFDCEDGLRLVVTKEHLGQLTAIHVSASIEEESLLHTCLPRGPRGLLDLTTTTRRRIQELFDTADPGEPVVWSTGFVPHWFLPTKE